ncbi:hypothetical protein GCM10010458_26830 [Microbacterium luteolum]
MHARRGGPSCEELGGERGEKGETAHLQNLSTGKGDHHRCNLRSIIVIWGIGSSRNGASCPPQVSV